jgi:hypothetical protein
MVQTGLAGYLLVLRYTGYIAEFELFGTTNYLSGTKTDRHERHPPTHSPFHIYEYQPLTPENPSSLLQVKCIANNICS